MPVNNKPAIKNAADIALILTPLASIYYLRYACSKTLDMLSGILS